MAGLDWYSGRSAAELDAALPDIRTTMNVYGDAATAEMAESARQGRAFGAVTFQMDRSTDREFANYLKSW